MYAKSRTVRSAPLASMILAFLAIAAPPPVCASYAGLQVSSQQTVIGGELRSIYRVYAAFSDPNDFLTAVAGSSPLGFLVILSRNADDSGPGSNFINDDFGLDVTFPAIGTAEIGMSFNMPEFIIGNSYIANGAWFTPGPVVEGRAGHYPDLRVLIMQLTVSSSSSVKGTVAITGINNIPLAGGQVFTATGQTFNSIPAPSTFSCFALVLFTQRRRRSQTSPESCGEKS